jgi:toxin FitB
MYLIDTNVISEARKGKSAHPGVQAFFKTMASDATDLYISSITVGEIRRGIDLLHHRGDTPQAKALEKWFQQLLKQYARHILVFDNEIAQAWGRLRVPHHENAIDKQIAATALMNDLILVTRNTSDFLGTGVRLLNPFMASSATQDITKSE